MKSARHCRPRALRDESPKSGRRTCRCKAVCKSSDGCAAGRPVIARELYETLRRRLARRNHIYFLLIKKADELSRKRVVAAACDPDSWGGDPGHGSLGNDVDDTKPPLL